jgi:hypothetical protein
MEIKMQRKDPENKRHLQNILEGLGHESVLLQEEIISR